MPRRPRIILPEMPVHIIQRGNNRSACFYSDDDYQVYLDWLEEYAKAYKCHIHSYVLMTNHVHLLITGFESDSISKLMKSLGQRYVQYINRSYRRSGTLWEGRFKSCLVQEEAYLMGCYRYIELNPVRANMVEHPADYPWSSYRTNAQGQGQKSTLIKPHNLYEALGLDEIERQAAYRELFRYELEPKLVDEIREATQGNYVLGNNRFAEQIAVALNRRVTKGKAGRPKKDKGAQ